jgi:cytochrome P450
MLPIAQRCRSITPALDPNPSYKWIPEMLDAPEHGWWRRALGPLFAPGAVAKLEDKVRSRAVELIDGFIDRGSCDFMADFAQRFPTSIFLELLGLPVEELPMFLRWEDQILHGAAPDGEAPGSARLGAMREVMQYFTGFIAQRRQEPKDDIISKSLTFSINGAPPSDEDLLSFLLLLFMAGLDTVTMTLGYPFWHLSTHPADRRRLATETSLTPMAIEEFLRAFAIVNPGPEGDGRHRGPRLPDEGR